MDTCTQFCYCGNSPCRLDTLLAEVFGTGRRGARRLIAEGRVRLAGSLAKAGSQVRPRDLVSLVFFTGTPATSNTPHPVFEDEFYLVIFKPSCLHTVSLSGRNAETTLAAYINRRWPECRTAGRRPEDAGLIQRLDFYTAGLMLAAKTPLAWKALYQLQTQGGITKRYKALVEGIPDFVEIRHKLSIALVRGKNRVWVSDDRLAPTPKQRVSDKKVSEKRVDVSATSEVRVLQVFPALNLSLLEVIGQKMRRHQVRVHCSSLGHPLLGDVSYGAARKLSEAEQLDLPNMGSVGFYLQAAQLNLIHPFTKRPLEFKA